MTKWWSWLTGLVFAASVGEAAADETYGADQSATPATSTSIDHRDGAVWRQPIRSILDEANSTLWILCQKNPSLVEVRLNDPAQKTFHSMEGHPEAIVRLSNGTFAVADSRGDRVLFLDPRLAQESGTEEIAVAADPRELLASAAGDRLWVTCRVGHQVQEIDPQTKRINWTTTLPFSPHLMAIDSLGTVLVVADAFRGRIAVMDPSNGRVLVTHSFPGTNIRGMAFTPDGQQLILAHQIISENSIIERETVRWGSFITNNVRRMSRALLMDPSANMTTASELGFVGGFGHGAGDPGKILFPSEDRVVICLGGVNDLGVDSGWPLRFDRIHVGRRPVDVVVDRSAKTAYVVNMFDDAISVVDLDRQQVVGSISLGPMPEETAEMRGEVLFHDARVSLDGWYSCQSCHTDGESNNSNADTLSDGGFGSPKNAPSLRGVSQTSPWSWVGKFEKLEDQVASTIEHTMQSNYTSSQRAADLSAYLSTLQPRPVAERSPGSASARGRFVFEELGCADCHSGDRLTKNSIEDVGLDDGLAGHRQFNPPSLRSLSQTAPYFHDGRAASIEEVIDRFEHRLVNKLSPPQRELLIEYLKSL